MPQPQYRGNGFHSLLLPLVSLSVSFAPPCPALPCPALPRCCSRMAVSCVCRRLSSASSRPYATRATARARPSPSAPPRPPRSSCAGAKGCPPKARVRACWVVQQEAEEGPGQGRTSMQGAPAMVNWTPPMHHNKQHLSYAPSQRKCRSLQTHAGRPCLCLFLTFVCAYVSGRTTALAAAR